MPEHRKGESRAAWMKRCVPHVMKKEGLSRKRAVGKCEGMYTSWKKKQKKRNSDLSLEDDIMMENKYEKEKYYEFQFNLPNGNVESPKFDYTEFVEKATGQKGFNMVIAIGNRFMKGVYVSKKELKLAHKGFNNTMHDLNHMGSGYMSFFSVIPPDISYIVGWQDNLSYDDATDEVRANVHIDKTAVRYDDWKTYINISEKIGRTPNVSMLIYGKIEWVEAKKLPKNSHYGKNGFKADDLVPCMIDIQPFMVSTVTKGACNDKDGCGIKNSCEDGNCNLKNNGEEKKVEVSPEDVRRKAYLEKRLKDLKLEKKKHD